ncbi:MAG: hypothetical protein ACJA2E_002425 [Arenicella sp.]|jgi:uncharacterized protein YcgL (UPF0745 family)
MQCYVYKGENNDNHFLYLKQEFDKDNLPDQFPDAILRLMGELNLVVEFELTADRILAQADAERVLADIQAHGFYLQMPKKDMDALEDEYFN